MRDFPGGRFYEPADLNFSARLIGAGGNVNGSIVPFSALFPIQTIAIQCNRTAGLSTSIDVRVDIFDIDGVTQLNGATPQLVWTTLNPSLTQPAMCILGEFNNVGGVPTTGANQIGGLAILRSWPYVRLNVANNDGVNSLNLTMRIMLVRLL